MTKKKMAIKHYKETGSARRGAQRSMPSHRIAPRRIERVAMLRSPGSIAAGLKHVHKGGKRLFGSMTDTIASGFHSPTGSARSSGSPFGA
jgi:hypothetical protein